MKWITIGSVAINLERAVAFRDASVDAEKILVFFGEGLADGKTGFLAFDGKDAEQLREQLAANKITLNRFQPKR